MRYRAGGILIKDNKILLIHRFKTLNGILNEYYVIPGGKVEVGEDLVSTTIRELKEEVGIDIKVLSDTPKYVYSNEEENHYYFMVEHIDGIIGTGTGPEFSDEKYEDSGEYYVELIPLKDILEGKINLVPKSIKENLINDIKEFNI